MKKFLWLLAAMALAGCLFEAPGAPGEDGFGPPPAGHVWAKIVVNAGANRALSKESNKVFIDYYEIYFRDHAAPFEKPSFGSAMGDRPLVVAVVPDKAYDILLLAGSKEYRILLASAYDDNGGSGVMIHAGQTNVINLGLSYVESDPTDTTNPWKYTGDDDTNIDDEVSRADIIGSPLKKVAAYTDITVNSSGQGTGYGTTVAYVFEITGLNGQLSPVRFSITSNNTNGFAGETTTGLLNPGSFDSTATGYGTDHTSVAVTFVSGGAHSNDDLKVDITTANLVDRDVVAQSGTTAIPWLRTNTDSSGAWGITRTNNLAFKILVVGLGPLSDAQGGTAPVFRSSTLFMDPLFRTDKSLTFQRIPGTSSPATYNLGLTELSYSIAAANLPGKHTYGILYYQLEYAPFGDPSFGPIWKIRNGYENRSLDEGTGSLGGGVLVIHGGPGRYQALKEEITVDVNLL